MTATAISAPNALDPTPASLRIDEALARLRREQPRLRALEAAQRLGISEAELVALEGNPRLRPDFGAILRAMPELGEVMVLCRNHACVHERHGRYEKVSVNDGMGLVLGPDIDLRLFLNQWAYGFACRQQLPSGLRESLQFFDRHGAAVQGQLGLAPNAEQEPDPADRPRQDRPATQPAQQLERAPSGRSSQLSLHPRGRRRQLRSAIPRERARQQPGGLIEGRRADDATQRVFRCDGVRVRERAQAPGVPGPHLGPLKGFPVSLMNDPRISSYPHSKKHVPQCVTH